jgi:hypothetical protein
MTKFDFLSVLVSIIVALGISHILSCAARLINRRGRVTLYFPTLIWMVSLFLLLVFIWWVSFHRREVADWTFFGFLLYLLIPILVSISGYLLIPELELELEPQFDLEKQYFHNRRWFFGVLGGLTAIGFLEDAVRMGAPRLEDPNFSIRLVFVPLIIGGFGIQAKRAQIYIALMFLVTLLCYIGFVFGRL